MKEISYPEFDIDFNYNYDTLGNITSIVKNDGVTVSYEYDNLNQLVRENNPYRNKTHTYEYENGNMTYYHVYNYTTGNLPSTPLYTVQFHYNNATWCDVVTKKTKTVYNSDGTTTVTNTTITSDAIGNITKIGSTSYGWTGRRLDSIGSNITYKYNIDGQRVKKTVSGVTTEYYYNGSILAGQKTGNNKMVFMYDNNGDVFGFIYNGETYYYVKNVQNDVFGITDSTGTAVATYRYDAWGNIISKTDTSGIGIADINPIRYRSYYYDTESGMYYLNSRYYMPNMGRFLCADTTDVISVQSDLYDKNLFAYCDNNPVVRADNGGDLWHIVAGAVIGGIFELGSQILFGEEINLARVGVATLAGGITAAVGPLVGAAISGTANITLDMMNGERDIKKLAVSGIIGAGASLVGSGIGKVVEKVGGKVATKVLSKMSKTNLKKVVTNLDPAIKGAKRNMIKNISYLSSEYPNIGTRYFMSSHLGRTLTTSIGQITEGFTGIGANYGRARWLPSW